MSKAIFFDIDGTLLDSINGKHKISKSVCEAIYSLQAQGNYVFIATGRPYAFVSDYIKNFGFNGFILANGAQIILNEKTIFEGKMAPAVIKELLEEFDQHKIQYILESNPDTYLKQEFEEFASFYEKFNILPNPRIHREYDLEELDILKIEVLCTKEETISTCKELLSRHPEYDYFSSITSNIFELYQKKYTKGSAILRLLEHLHIPVEQSFAFGDGTNDIEMLQIAGCGIAMGNASDYVKSFADEVTDTIQEDGVAAGIKKYVLA